MRRLGWQWVDPLCSLAVAGCILAAALPLVSDSAAILLMRTPPSLRGERGRACAAALRALPHVSELVSCQIWSHTSAKALGTVRVRVKAEADESIVRDRVERVGQAQPHVGSSRPHQMRTHH